MGYESDMIDRALHNDDVQGFEYFLSLCGGTGCKTFLGESMPLYAAKRRAKKCLEWLFAQNVHSDGWSDERVREYAERPEY